MLAIGLGLGGLGLFSYLQRGPLSMDITFGEDEDIIVSPTTNNSSTQDEDEEGSLFPVAPWLELVAAIVSGSFLFFGTAICILARRYDGWLIAGHRRVMTLEEIDQRTKAPQQKKVFDDGYRRLDVAEYVALRTQVATRRIKRENRPIGRYLMALQILIAVATMLSVVLGSTDNDLFIASSTALVSFFQTWLENGQYNQRVKTNQKSIKQLAQREYLWRALTFHEKRQPDQRDKLVEETEAAIMAIYDRLYDTTFAAPSAKWDDKEHAAKSDAK